MFYIQQIGEQDCGITALKILLANLFKKEDYLFIREDENHGPYSFFELIDIAKKWGVTLSGVKYDTVVFDEFPTAPFLALLQLSEEVTHLIYVDKIKKDKVYYYDSAKGKGVFKRDEFFELFEGSILMVESIDKEEKIESRVVDLPLKTRVFSSVIQILSYVALILGMSFLKGDTYIFIPIICFSLYVIMQILLEKYLISSMKIVDSIYLSLVTNAEHDTSLFIKRLSEYKKSLFISPIKFFGDIIISLFLAIVMVVNDLNSVYIILAIVLILLFDVLLIRGVEKRKIEDVSYQEKTLKNYYHTEEYTSRMMSLHDKVYELAIMKRSVRYISIFLLLLVCVGVMMINKIVSVPYILVHLIFAITIYDKTKEILYFEDDVEKKKVDYMKLINLINQ